MWTLTYAGEGQHDRDQALSDVAGWVKRLRAHLGHPFPYLCVLELHPGGHGWHVHVLMPRKFIRHEVMARLWGHGFVQFSDENRRIRRVPGQRARSRAAAGYLSKYVAKAVGSGIDRHRHAYEVAEGFAPEKISRECSNFADGWRELVRDHGGELPSLEWSSDQVEDWSGPPCWFFMWDG